MVEQLSVAKEEIKNESSTPGQAYYASRLYIEVIILFGDKY